MSHPSPYENPEDWRRNSADKRRLVATCDALETRRIQSADTLTAARERGNEYKARAEKAEAELARLNGAPTVWMYPGSKPQARADQPARDGLEGLGYVRIRPNTEVINEPPRVAEIEGIGPVTVVLEGEPDTSTKEGRKEHRAWRWALTTMADDAASRELKNAASTVWRVLSECRSLRADQDVKRISKGRGGRG